LGSYDKIVIFLTVALKPAVSWSYGFLEKLSLDLVWFKGVKGLDEIILAFS